MNMNLEPTESDLEQVTDAVRVEMGLPPPAMTPEKGVAVMTARVTELRELKRRMLVQYAEAPECQVLSLDQEITSLPCCKSSRPADFSL